MGPEVFFAWKNPAGEIVCGYWVPATCILTAAYAQVDPAQFAGGFAEATWSVEASRNMPPIAPTTNTRAIESLAAACLSGCYVGHAVDDVDLEAIGERLRGWQWEFLEASPSGWHVWLIE